MEQRSRENVSLAASGDQSWSIGEKRPREASKDKQYAVSPDYAYKSIKMTLDQLQRETNKTSKQFHDLTGCKRKSQQQIGLLRLEVLQCIGLPKLDALGETDAYCIAVCGDRAFRTDTIQEDANPRWLPKMRRACIFPIFEAYAKLFVGVFDADSETDRDDFAGRVVVDLVRLRPNSTYDVLLPLRESAHVYTNRPRGAVRLRIHLTWSNPREMMLSYLPRSFRRGPFPNVTVSCSGKKSFQGVALTVHGTHMPGRFSLKLLRAIIREVSLTQIHILRYLRVREIMNLRSWKSPLISAFVFSAWMHAVYRSTARYVPGHVVCFLLLRLWKNYLLYPIDKSCQRGFLPPTLEELLGCLVLGKNTIAPLEYNPQFSPVIRDLGPKSYYLFGDGHNEVLERAANALRQVPVKNRRGRLTFLGSDAVTTLVKSGFASSRAQAVELGMTIQEKFGMFEHYDKLTEFSDSSIRFHFVSSQTPYDDCRTHRPWGTVLLRLFGSQRQGAWASKRAEEMPFAPSSECPRRPIEDSFVTRSKDQTNPVASAYEDEQLIQLQPSSSHDDEDAILIPTFGSDNSLHSVASTGSSSLRVEHLAKPPPQDIDTRTRADKPISAVFRDLRDKAHGYMLHLFEEKAYELKMKSDAFISTPSPTKTLRRVASFDEPSRRRRSEPTHRMQRRTSLRQVAGTISQLTEELPQERRRRSLSNADFPGAARRRSFSAIRRRSLSNAESTHQRKDQPFRSRPTPSSRREYESTKEELDRLLKIGGSSTSNPWVSKIGVLLQPMIEIALAFLSLFRSLHNLFTWQDPVLSTWFSIAGIGLVILLHVFPWRWAALVAGIAFVGPQNWFLRILRERRGIPEHDMDLVFHEMESKRPCEGGRTGPPFSLKINSSNESTPSKIRHVVVPTSQLTFSHRFYDWPPDPKFSRVVKPPTETDPGEAEGTPNVRVSSLLSGTAESHWASQFVQLDDSDSGVGADPIITFSLASGHYRPKSD